MRLLNARTLTLREFFDDERPDYAILSHRWGSEEVSYREICEPTPATMAKEGFRKIQGCCRQAIIHGLEYVWADTCCIDKSNEAELVESIRSMYRWYCESRICFAYLADVEPVLIESPSSDVIAALLAPSVWFTRGWTLQELLAPSRVCFLDQAWRELGSKQELKSHLAVITGIDETVLCGESSVADASIARRMSWASRRTTTRIEDTAFCLLGIFDVDMPMVYGEGKGAFIRLQQEILKTSGDHTIFAWKFPKFEDAEDSLNVASGLLASHPSFFRDSGDLVPFRGLHAESLLVNPTNIGLSLEVFQPPLRSGWSVLNCNVAGEPDQFAAIFLSAMDADKKQFVRTHCDTLKRLPLSGAAQRVYVRQNPRTVIYSTPKNRWIRFEAVRVPWWRFDAIFVCSQIQALPIDASAELPEITGLESEPVQSTPAAIWAYKFALPLSSHRLVVVLRGSSKFRDPEGVFHLAIGTDKDGQLAVRLVAGRNSWEEAKLPMTDDKIVHKPPYRSKLRHMLPGGNRLTMHFDEDSPDEEESFSMRILRDVRPPTD